MKRGKSAGIAERVEATWRAGLCLLLMAAGALLGDDLRASDCSFDEDPSAHDITSSSVKIEWKVHGSCNYAVLLVPEGSTCTCANNVGPCNDASGPEGPTAGYRSYSEKSDGSLSSEISVTFDDLAADQEYFFYVMISGGTSAEEGSFTTESDSGHPKRVRRAKDSDPEDLFDVLPFLQNPLDGDMTVVFQTDDSQSMSFTVAIPFGSACDDSDLGSRSLAATRSRAAVQDDPVNAPLESPDHVYQLTMTDFSADLKYWYWVILEGEDQLVGGDDYNFITLDDDGDAFSFYVYGDNRSQPEQAGWVVQAMQNDLYSEQNTSSSFPRFIVSTGDYAVSGCSQSDWLEEYFGPSQPLLKNIAVFTAPGNHEYSDCTSAGFYFGYFVDPDGVSQDDKEIYSFDYLNSRFISLDIVSSSDDGDLDDDLVFEIFFQEQLSETDDIDQIFTFYHAPALTQISGGVGHESNTWQIANLAPWLQGVGDGKVAAVFSGHNHFYERSHSLLNVCPSSSSTNPFGVDCSDTDSSCGTQPDGAPEVVCKIDSDKKEGVTYLVSGGGGAPLYPVPDSSDYAGWLAIAEDEFHFVTVTVDGTKSSGVTSAVTSSSSSTIDTFSLRYGD